MTGVQTAIALAAVQGFPPAIQDLVTSLDKELDRYVPVAHVLFVSSHMISAACRVQEQHALPSDMGQWADILTIRLQCHFDMFTNATPYAITRSYSMLRELYPGDADLTTLLRHEVDMAKQRSSDLDGLWLQVCIVARYMCSLLTLCGAVQDVVRRLPSSSREG